MKRFVIAAWILLFPILGLAQFKSQAVKPDISEAITRPLPNLLLGLLNPDKFHMNHTFSTSFASFGGGGMMVNSYVNTMQYQISDPLKLRVNLGLMNVPYTSFSDDAGLNRTRFFGSAELQYRPSDKTLIQFGVGSTPGYYGYDAYALDPFYRSPYRLRSK